MPLLQKLKKINVNVKCPRVGTSVNVKSPPEVWGRPGVGLEIDRCIRVLPTDTYLGLWDMWGIMI